MSAYSSALVDDSQCTFSWLVLNVSRRVILIQFVKEDHTLLLQLFVKFIFKVVRAKGNNIHKKRGKKGRLERKS